MKLGYPILGTLVFLLLVQAGNSAATKAAEPSRRPTLPRDVEKRDVTIFSDDVRMAGDLYLPKGLKSAEKIKTPMLIIEAGKDELIKPADNGQRVADILKADGTPVEYHLFEDMTHYGIYKEKFAEATKLELDWFNKYLKTSGPGPAARKRARR